MKPTRVLWAVLAYVAAWVWAWWSGPVGLVTGVLIFWAGFAFGKRSGRRDATYRAARDIVRSRPEGAIQ